MPKSLANEVAEKPAVRVLQAGQPACPGLLMARAMPAIG